MEFYCWNVFIRSIGSKNRWVPLYTPWAFSIMAENSKWRISEIDQILISSNIGILYTVGKLIQFWTTFLLTKKPGNELTKSNKCLKVLLWRHFFRNFLTLQNPDMLYTVGKLIISCTTFLLMKKPINEFTKSNKCLKVLLDVTIFENST